MPEINRRPWTVYLISNIALIFSLALPVAGILNQLLEPATKSLARAGFLWLFVSLVCFILTLPLVPVIRRRTIDRIDRITEG